MLTNKRPLQNNVFVLIATDFDELPVIQCVCQMRAQGLSVGIIGLTPGLLNGLRGVTIRPDFHLTEIEEMIKADGRRLLVISGGQECTAKLLTDPRIHQLIEKTLRADGFVAAFTTNVPSALTTVIPLPNWDTSRFMVQGHRSATEFVDQLIRWIT